MGSLLLSMGMAHVLSGGRLGNDMLEVRLLWRSPLAVALRRSIVTVAGKPVPVMRFFCIFIRTSEPVLVVSYDITLACI